MGVRMNVEFRPIPGAFGVQLEGIDLHYDHPVEVRDAVRSAWLDHALVLVRGQDLAVEQHQRFV